MKKIIIGLVCVLVVTSLIPAMAKSKPEDVIITNEEKLYQFQKPDKVWEEKEAGKFNDYCFVRRGRSTIFIGSRIYTTELEDFDLSATQHSWIQAMQKKYKLRNLKIIEEAETTIDGHSAIWNIIKYKAQSGTWKERIYLLKGGGKFYYRLRLSCLKKYFDRHLEGFEQLVKSFKLLPFKVPVTTEAPTYLINRDKHYQFQKLGETWSEETAKYDDYKFVNKTDWSSIRIGSEKYTTAPEGFDLYATRDSWIKEMKKRYNWTDHVVIEQNETIIAERPALYTVIEVRRGPTSIKYKIYLVKGDKFYYRLVLAGYKVYFDGHLEKFEQLVRSFEIT